MPLLEDEDEELPEDGVEGDPFSDPLSFESLLFLSFLAAVVYWVMSKCAGNLILVSILEAPIECSKRYQ